MKCTFTFLFLLLFASGFTQQVDSSKVPYLVDKKIPFFKMLLTDSSVFYKSDIKKKKATVIVYFSPECEHCQLFTQQLTKRIKEFGKTQWIMISPLPFKEVKDFYNKYDISNYSSIKMGFDSLFFFGSYFQAHYIPFIAAYNKKGELIRGWEGGTTVDEILKELK
jgi:thioredoxin-related protein